MGNLWAFLLQTLWASLTAGLLLIVKRLLEDKLSPRWQYGIWGLLAARLLLPASLRRYVVLPMSDWLEFVKTMAEKRLSSAWTDPYALIVVRSLFPMATGTPRSVTDWLFVLYCAGIVFVLMRYLTGYLRLRLALRHCPPVPPAVQESVDRMAERYGLPSCPAVAANLPSAMVCGVFRPVLAFPGGVEPDEKILLHELLHLKYLDTAQNVFWSLLRALHWCNPFLWWVFDRIQNDLESLCDQRVLERLAGEARREYGYLLLGQASVLYARFPGTSSISNGEANIRRRVEAVARFQRYPRGMALVSVCIALALGGTVLFGTVSAYSSEDFSAWTEVSLARTRVQRCTTLAGALDTYAKAVILQNGYYFATASPLSRQEELAGMENWEKLFPDTPYLIPGSCKIANLRREGDGYRALLVFPVLNREDRPTDAAIPVRVWQENPELGVMPGLSPEWVVERDGDWEIYPEKASFQTYSHSRKFPCLGNTEARGDSGNLSLKWRTLLYIKSEAQQPGNWPFYNSFTFDQSLSPGAQFDHGDIQTEIHYTVRSGLTGPEKCIGLQAAPLSDPEQDWTFQRDKLTGSGGGGTSDGESESNKPVIEDWDGTAELWMYQTISDVWDGQISLPAAYRVRVFWDSFPVETLTIRTEGGGEQ